MDDFTIERANAARRKSVGQTTHLSPDAQAEEDAEKVTLEQEPEQELEQEPEQELDQEPEQEPEQELDQEPEQEAKK